jgi:hypothetical protein
MKRTGIKKPRLLASVGVAMLVVGPFAAAPAAAKPPVGKTYFVVSLGLAADAQQAYALDVGCLRFTGSEICDTGGDCGSWWMMEEAERAPKQLALGYEFAIVDDETGQPVTIEGVGRVDSRGAKSAFSGVARGVDETSGAQINFAVAGRAVGAARCRRLVAEFEAAGN